MRIPFLLALLAAPAAAGEIFGDLRAGEQFVAQAPLVLACGADTTRGTTDATGSFRLSGKGTGKCTLTVTWQKQQAAVDVVVFEKPARYRLMLEMKDGKAVLRRT